MTSFLYTAPLLVDNFLIKTIFGFPVAHLKLRLSSEGSNVKSHWTTVPTMFLIAATGLGESLQFSSNSPTYSTEFLM